ncbi:MAG: hypothetical protein AAF840_12470, partial [Bacteroidota bacterium]
MNESTKNLDALLRRRLQQELPLATPPPGGWVALKRELDADVDLQLQAALTGLAGAPPTGWQALEQKLDPPSPQDMALADKLNRLQPVPATEGWDRLVARMDAENEEKVDAIVSTGLAQAGTGTTSGWAALAARLELIGWRRGVVSAWKIMEGALLLSFLLLLLRFGPTSNFPLLPNQPAEPLATLTVPEVEEITEIPAKTVVEVVGLRSQPQFAPQALVIKVADNTKSATEHLVERQPTEVAETTKEIPAAVIPPSRAVVPVGTLPIEKLVKEISLPSPVLHLPKVQKGDPVHYYVNAFVSPFDFNEVVTPTTPTRDLVIDADRRFTQGGSLGLLFDVQQGKNALQVGAIYSRRSYIPTALKWFLQDEYEHTPIEPVKGYSRFRYQNVTFDFNYKRTLLEKTNWRMSARVGMSLSVIAFSAFEGREDVVDAFNAQTQRRRDLDNSSAVQGGGRSPGPEGGYSGLHQITNPPNGWLEGGSILTNSSFYLGGGLVMERLLDTRWSIYVSPSFGRVIYLKPDQGIGPY